MEDVPQQAQNDSLLPMLSLSDIDSYRKVSSSFALSVLEFLETHYSEECLDAVLEERAQHTSDQEALTSLANKAARQDNVTCVAFALDFGARAGSKVLNIAARHNSANVVEYLFAALRLRDQAQYSAMKTALRTGSMDVVRALEDEGLEPSSLQDAVKSGKVGVVQYVLDAGYRYPSSIASSFVDACKRGYLDIAILLSRFVAVGKEEQNTGLWELSKVSVPKAESLLRVLLTNNDLHLLSQSRNANVEDMPLTPLAKDVATFFESLPALYLPQQGQLDFVLTLYPQYAVFF
jgi:hypothetical protein